MLPKPFAVSYQAFMISPRLTITSPQKGCEQTILLIILADPSEDVA